MDGKTTDQIIHESIMRAVRLADRARGDIESYEPMDYETDDRILSACGGKACAK